MSGKGRAPSAGPSGGQPPAKTARSKLRPTTCSRDLAVSKRGAAKDLKLKLIIAESSSVILIVIIVPLVTTFRTSVATPSQAAGVAN
ncbi:hypothetical protein BC829DRAFT_445801 [Chytridium lagenaria]|nr:hypothetical protein BC829DRAFT_445801 [Chytridium lagenaria]